MHEKDIMYEPDFLRCFSGMAKTDPFIISDRKFSVHVPIYDTRNVFSLMCGSFLEKASDKQHIEAAKG